MNFNGLFPLKEIDLPQFQEFFDKIALKVEKIISNELKSQSISKIIIFSVFNEMSWTEWLKRPLSFVTPLSTILVTLLYDKVTYMTQLLAREPEFQEFINLYQASDFSPSHKERERNIFLQKLHILFHKAFDIEPRALILKTEIFPINKILNFILNDEDICFNVINLINQIIFERRFSFQLLIPYIFEIAIPTQQKQLKGQVFTPLKVIEYICKENIDEQTSRIIDPACGTGIFLLGALANRFSHYQGNQQIEIIGTEEDKNLAAIAESALSYFIMSRSFFHVNISIYNEDFFNLDRLKLNSLSKNSNLTTILMNPPYTRQEKLSSKYKAFLNNKIKNDLKTNFISNDNAYNALSGRAGLYSYFVIHAASLLNNNDRFGLIIPNSWLDVDYGVQLQRFILKNFDIDYLIVTRKDKLIPSVDVNTVIIKLVKKDNTSSDRKLVNFISIEKSQDIDFLLNDEIKRLSEIPNIQIISIKQKSLLNFPKWGIYHRGSPSFFKLMKKLGSELINLGEIAEVRRGFTTGANDFFYVGKPGFENKFFKSSFNQSTGTLLLTIKDKLTAKEFRKQGFEFKEPFFSIEKEYWMHQVDDASDLINWEYYFRDEKKRIWVPNYVIKSPKDVPIYEIREQNVKFVALLIPSVSSINELSSGILEYIQWGETWNPKSGKKFCKRPTCKSRKNWYELPHQEYKNFSLLCLMTINDRFPVFYNPKDFFFDARLYGIRFLIKKRDFFENYFIFLNSVITSIQLELLGRSNLGEGALDIKVYEYQMLKIPDLTLYSQKMLNEISKSFSFLINYSPISILHEKPEEVKKITEIFISKLFNLPLQFLFELQKDFRYIVQLRLEKAGYLTTDYQ
ncbi:MAG: N-6 DNA methylase [Candidatus Hodarchaeota archaeon]